MRVTSDSVHLQHRELAAFQSGRLAIPKQLIANGRTRWEMDLPDGSKVIIREEAHDLGHNIP